MKPFIRHLTLCLVMFVSTLSNASAGDFPANYGPKPCCDIRMHYCPSDRHWCSSDPRPHPLKCEILGSNCHVCPAPTPGVSVTITHGPTATAWGDETCYAARTSELENAPEIPGPFSFRPQHFQFSCKGMGVQVGDQVIGTITHRNLPNADGTRSCTSGFSPDRPQSDLREPKQSCPRPKSVNLTVTHLADPTAHALICEGEVAGHGEPVRFDCQPYRGLKIGDVLAGTLYYRSHISADGRLLCFGPGFSTNSR